MKIITVSGYKTFELGIFKEDDQRITYIKKAIEKKLIQAIESGLEWVLISGQIGVELWTAEVVLDLQEQNYEIQLGLIPPFENQQSRWPEHIQMLYEEISTMAQFFQPLYKGEYKGAYQFQAKNEWLLQKSDGCILLMDEEHQGSVKFFYENAKKYQEQNEYEMILITPFDLDEVVTEMSMQENDWF